MRPGDGPWVWYVTRGFPPVPEVLGIYEEPPPEACSDLIKTHRVADIGAVPLLVKMTRVRDRIFEAAEDLWSIAD